MAVNQDTNVAWWEERAFKDREKATVWQIDFKMAPGSLPLGVNVLV